MRELRGIVLLIILGQCQEPSFALADSLSGNGINTCSFVVPALFCTYGLTTLNNNGWPSSRKVKNFRDENFSGFNTSADDYLVFTPALMMYAMNAFNIPGKSDFLNQNIICAKASLLALGITYSIKYLSQQTRPDGSNNYSFPSGHSAAVFALAEVLHQEYKDYSLLYAAGYATASAVAMMRIANNEHWWSDVWMGAGIGLISTKLCYLTHRYKWKWNQQVKLTPAVVPGTTIGVRYALIF